MNNRLKILPTLLEKHKLDAILISSVSNITYFTNYSGFSSIEREAYLLLTKSKYYLLTDGRYTEAVRNIPNFTLVEISATNSLSESFFELAKTHNIQKLGIEENNLTVAEYKKNKKFFTRLTNISLRELRIVKEKNEIDAIEKACHLGDKTFDYVLKKIKQGITEKQLAYEIEFFIKKAGADISFTPIVAFENNAAIPHHQTSNQKLKTNNWVLLDFGVKINTYCSDMTRTVFFGTANDEQKHKYQTVFAAQQKAIDYLSSLTINHKSISAAEIDNIARDHITSQNYPSIPHSLGHGIGLEVHEAPNLSPKSKDTLKPGMVFSVEPGIYIPGTGGVRIEDLVVLEPTGPRLLTKSPRNLIEL